MKTLHFAAASLAISAVFAVAQNKAPVSGVPLRMVVTVEAYDGKDIPALNRDDVMVFERQDRAQVTEWIALQGDHARLELYVLVDDAVSSSVGIQLSDIRRFIEQQTAASAIGIGYLRNGIVEIRQTPTLEHAKAAAALRILLSSTGTMASPYLSLSDLTKRWPAGSIRREVLMITSGDNPLGGLAHQIRMSMPRPRTYNAPALWSTPLIRQGSDTRAIATGGQTGVRTTSRNLPRKPELSRT